jgi:hypothetical protein
MIVDLYRPQVRREVLSPKNDTRLRALSRQKTRNSSLGKSEQDDNPRECSRAV